jgi:hypothetical protein
MTSGSSYTYTGSGSSYTDSFTGSYSGSSYSGSYTDASYTDNYTVSGSASSRGPKRPTKGGTKGGAKGASNGATTGTTTGTNGATGKNRKVGRSHKTYIFLKGGFFSKFEWRPRVFSLEGTSLRWAKERVTSKSKSVFVPGCTIRKGIYNDDFIIELCSKKKYYYRLRFKDISEGERFLKKIKLVLRREEMGDSHSKSDHSQSEELASDYQQQSSGSIEASKKNTKKGGRGAKKSESFSGSSFSGSSYYSGSYSGSVRSSSDVTASGVSQKSKRSSTSGSSVYSSTSDD